MWTMTYISLLHPCFWFPWVREDTSGVETGSALSKWPWPAIATAACPRLHWRIFTPILWARGRWTRKQEASETKFPLWWRNPWGAIWAFESDATRIVAIAVVSRTKRGGRKVPGFRVQASPGKEQLNSLWSLENDSLIDGKWAQTGDI